MFVLNQQNRVVKSFLFFLIFVLLLYLISAGLAFLYLPSVYIFSPDVQNTIFGYVWYWTFKGVEIIWYWGMVIVIIIGGGVIDVLLKAIFEPVIQALIDPSFYYAGAEFKTTLTLIQSVGVNIIHPLQQLGEELQVISIQGLKNLLEG